MWCCRRSGGGGGNNGDGFLIIIITSSSSNSSSSSNNNSSSSSYFTNLQLNFSTTLEIENNINFRIYFPFCSYISQWVAIDKDNQNPYVYKKNTYKYDKISPVVLKISSVFISSPLSYIHTGCFTTLGHNCRRWFPRSLWWKKFI